MLISLPIQANLMEIVDHYTMSGFHIQGKLQREKNGGSCSAARRASRAVQQARVKLLAKLLMAKSYQSSATWLPRALTLSEAQI